MPPVRLRLFVALILIPPLLVVQAVCAQDFVPVGMDIDGKTADEHSGWSVSLSGDGSVVAIGSRNDFAHGYWAGRVRVFEREGNAWFQRGADFDAVEPWDKTGYSVSLSSDGSVVAIGAPGHSEAGSYSGHVRVYAWENNAWVQRGLDIDGEEPGDESGYSVALSSDGTVLAIGAPENDGNGSNSGYVRVFVWDGTDWIQRRADITGENPHDYSGFSVSLSSDGHVLAVGARLNDGNGSGSGHVRVFVWDGMEWSQRGADIDGEAAGDQSGWAVSLSADGSVVAIGAPQNGGNESLSGHVRIHAWDGSAWRQRGEDIDGEEAGDQSGWSMSLSSDGTVVAIGAPWNDGGGSHSGHVRVHAWDGNVWRQRGSDINGESSGDFSGRSVSLSSDGVLVAIGAILGGNTGPGAGYVRILEFKAYPVNSDAGLPEELPSDVYLTDNYPNPFNPSTTIEFGLPKPGPVRLELFDVQGRLVRILVAGEFGAGHHRVHADLSGVPSGAYLYQMQSSGRVLTRMLHLMK